MDQATKPLCHATVHQVRFPSVTPVTNISNNRLRVRRCLGAKAFGANPHP